MPASIFAGSKVKTLKDTLTLNGFSDIISSADDPTASAVDAPIGSLLINRTSGKLYRKLDAGSSVNWEEVGSGTGGINYILNPSAEVNTTGWATYADAAGAAPVDGSGGSPTVTWTRSTTSPLRGVADFNFAKDAANRQGQGVSYDFTIDEADKAKVLTVTFDYEVLSGTYADGDLTVYLIADPAGTPVVIQPAGYTVQSATVGTTMRQSATFQTQATGTSYRLCFHVASTSASAYTLAVDNVVVGPQPVVSGVPASDWVSYTPAVTSIIGLTVGTKSGKWRRTGDSIEVQFGVNLGAGTPTPGTNFSFAQADWLPSGLAVDSAKIMGAGFGSYGQSAVFGGAIADDASVATGGDQYAGTVSVSVTGELSITSGTADRWDDASPFAWGSTAGDTAIITVTGVPISGWSSNTVMSSDTDTRVVALTANDDTTGTGVSFAVAGTFYPIPFPDSVDDTHGTYNSSTGVYTVPVSGYYKVDVNCVVTGCVINDYIELRMAAATDSNSRSRLRVDSTGDYNISLSRIYYANAGSTITPQIRNVTSAAGSLKTGSGSFNFISINRLSGPATIAASETVACTVGNLSAPTLGNVNNVVLPMPTKIFDTHNSYTSATGYSVPVSGKYLATFQYTTQTYSTASSLIGRIQLDGTNQASAATVVTGTSAQYTFQVTALIDALAGQIIRPIAYSSAGAPQLSASTSENYISIVRVGN